MSQVKTDQEIADYIKRLNQGWKQILFAIPPRGKRRYTRLKSNLKQY